jgi:hypothetical protein
VVGNFLSSITKRLVLSVSKQVDKMLADAFDVVWSGRN